MEDYEIIALFNERSEQAIREIKAKYGKTIRGIAYRIVGNMQDAEECENDTYLAVWQRIPPESPEPLAAYLYRIARNTAITKYHANTAQKRCGTYDLALDELSELIPGNTGNPLEACREKELTEAIEVFLLSLEKDDRYLFMRRYWYLDPVREIALQTHRKPHYVTVRLSRIRDRLRKYLQKEGLL